MRPRVIVVVGPSCSGKGVVARRLSALGYRSFELSAGLRSHVPTGLGFEERLAHLSALYRRTRGRVLIDELLPSLREVPRDVPVAIIGARQIPELDELSSHYGEATVIGVYSPTELRFQRAQRRARVDGPATFPDFLRLTFWEYSIGLADLMYRARHLLFNTGAEEDLAAAVDNLLPEQPPPAS